MNPLQAKPAYHHPIPWQVVVALVLIAASLASLTYLASLLWTDYGSRTERAAPIWPLIVAAAAIVVQAVVAVSLAARMDWARITGFGLCLFTSVAATVGGLIAGIDVPSFTGIGIGIVLFFLLRSDKAGVYTYKGRARGWPED